MRKVTILCLVAVFPLAGCATLFSGGYTDVVVSSYPAGAKVFYNEVYRGNAPTTLTLERSEDHAVRIELDGYQPYEVTFAKKMNSWMWVDFAWAGFMLLSAVEYQSQENAGSEDGIDDTPFQLAVNGFVPIAVDYFTGAAHDISPTTVNARFSKKEVNSRKRNGKFFVRVNMTPWRGQYDGAE